jgi:YYY domain-containing protein
MSIDQSSDPTPPLNAPLPEHPANKPAGLPTGLIFDLLLIVVLLLGAYLRITGWDWDDINYLHPDERFLAMVESGIKPVEKAGDYFNTETSTLNPNNQGFGFFVYGTLPIFLTRYVAEALDLTGYSDIAVVGRPLSAMFDLLTIGVLYLTVSYVYDKRVGLLAAAFSSVAVLQIQLSHFFTVDIFLNFFIWCALYFAVRIAGTESRAPNFTRVKQLLLHPVLWSSVLFGLFLGAAVASKLLAGALAIILPLAAYVYLVQFSDRQKKDAFLPIFLMLSAGALVSLIVFRVGQPYTFNGPGFFGVSINESWLNNIRSLQGQRNASAGFPPSIQWFDRSSWFSGLNLTTFGIGPIFGVVAWLGFLWMGWRIVRGDWRKHIVLWGWVAIYFLWQSFEANPTMRYQLPIYPGMAMFGAWALVRVWDLGTGRMRAPLSLRQPRLGSGLRLLAVVLGLVALTASTTYAFAFSSIYTRTVTRIEASRWFFQNVPGPINLDIETEAGPRVQMLPVASETVLRPSAPYSTVFRARETGQLTAFRLGTIEAEPGTQFIRFVLRQQSDLAIVADAQLVYNRAIDGPVPTLTLESPVQLQKDETYLIELNHEGGTGQIVIRGARVANETSWDDAVPMRIDNYDPYGGIYQGLNLELYWEDNPDKLLRTHDILDQADVVVITSSRQWGSLTRIPEKWPIVSAYYRNLMGCPADRSVEWCYNVADVGMFEGSLGFNLVAAFQSDPTLAGLSINDQFSEEAFTVYDHPKVLIFVKDESYDSERTYDILSAAGYGHPGELGSSDGVTLQVLENQKSLLLPEDRLEAQSTAGTWSQLFNPEGLLNRFQPLTVLVWYGAVFMIGLAAYPIVRTALPGLTDKGYALTRIAGLLILSYLVWLAGSLGVAVERGMITLAFLLLLLISGLLFWPNRQKILAELLQNKRYLIVVEVLFLAFFAFLLLIRIGNPDLWHPWKGGEKPMDFSYFNAVLKSNTFPPYDPWFAGGYINYYYYGFVYVGVLTKWLGILPSIAYNLILPTLYATLSLGAFSVAYNLVTALRTRAPAPAEPKPEPPEVESEGAQVPEERPEQDRLKSVPRVAAWTPYLTGLAAALFVSTLGNLGTVRMMFVGWQRIAAPPDVIVEEAFFLTRWVWAVRGLVAAVGGDNLPYSVADWYWNPSRAIPAPGEVEPITEFPFFTFLYADLHAHMLALPLTVLALAWAVSVLLAKGRWQGVSGTIVGFLLGGLVIGSLWPTNTWDYPTYLVLGVIALVFVYGRRRLPILDRWGGLGLGILAAAVLVGLTRLLFLPFFDAYALGYTDTGIWDGLHTPLGAYLTHWGLFIFVIFSWMSWETIDWMARTPISALRKVMKLGLIIAVSLLLLLIWVIGLYNYLDVSISWFVLPAAAWAGVLLLRPGISDAKRAALFMIGTGLILSLTVEIVVLSGDIGRMNTVFKFYLQVWTLFAVSAALALGWLVPGLVRWRPAMRSVWQVALAALLFGAVLYPMLGSLAKVEDRMSADAPVTLDGMAYMPFSNYHDQGQEIQLDQDYRAIRWLQDNVDGTPVIVEAQIPEYRWGSRYAIYTGLPAVLGWNWHQRQQRTGHDADVWTRATEISDFYITTNQGSVQNFLDQYQVSYIIVGQVERAYYAENGIAKFDQWSGSLWNEVYRDGETVIYEVIN